MKKVFILFIILLASIAMYAQAPTHFKYQGVARDADNQPFTNTALGLKISIVRDNGNGSGSGIVEYSEKHLISTSATGIFSLNVGGGEATFGDIEEIDWANHTYWLKVEMDVTGGEDYTFMGNSPILPVPIAVHAMTVADKDDADADPQNELQTIAFDPNTNELTISDGNTINIPAGQADADADPQNELQELNFDLNTLDLTISDGNTVHIPIDVDDNDHSPFNEFQTIELVGNNLVLSDGGGEVDLSGLGGGGGTDDQTLQLNGTTLSIEDGNQIDLAVIQDGTEDADADPQNELQELLYTPATGKLILTQGSTVFLPIDDIDPLNEIQQLNLNGNTLSLTNGGGQVNLAGIGGSSLWSQNGANNDIFTNENVAIGFDHSQLAMLEVMNDFIIRDNDGNVVFDMYSTSAGGTFNIKKGADPNYFQISMKSVANHGGSIDVRNTLGAVQGKLFSSDVGGQLELRNPQEGLGFYVEAEAFGTLEELKKPNGGSGLIFSSGGNGGSAYLYGKGNSIALVTLGTELDHNRGQIMVGDSLHTKLLHLGTMTGDAGGITSGLLQGFNSQGNNTFKLGAVSDAQSMGFLSIYDADNSPAVYMTGRFGGEIILQSGNGVNKRNVTIGAVTGSDNMGIVSVHNATGTDKAGMFVNNAGQGVLYADVKNFRMEHPMDKTKEIWYACVEGPEAAAYERGTAQLIDGEATIVFPNHFQLVANSETMTVMLTPLSADCKGLAVVEKTATGFKVKELFHGAGTYQFDWEVKCVRKGYEGYQAVREKR